MHCWWHGTTRFPSVIAKRAKGRSEKFPRKARLRSCVTRNIRPGAPPQCFTCSDCFKASQRLIYARRGVPEKSYLCSPDLTETVAFKTQVCALQRIAPRCLFICALRRSFHEAVPSTYSWIASALRARRRSAWARAGG